MQVLIDGHNALHALGLGGGGNDGAAAHEGAREQLVRQVAERTARAVVFFDARRSGRGRSTERVRHVSVRYCRNAEADADIVLAARAAAGRGESVLVVSNDREVTGRSRQVGAQVSAVRAFFDRPPTGPRAPRRGPGGGTPPRGQGMPKMRPEDFGLTDGPIAF